MKRSAILRICCLVFALSLASSACVEPSVVAPETDAAADLDVSKDVPAGDEDQGPDAPDATSDVTDQAPDLCDVCCPGAVICDQDGAVATCLPDGSGFDARPCGARQECEQGVCVAEKICTPGETQCFNATTQRICTPDGTRFTTQMCTPTQSCVRGACVEGKANSDTCTANADCAGNFCHCGSVTDEACSAGFSRAYCTSSCSQNNPCSDSEVCLDASIHAIDSPTGNYNHCLTKCAGNCAIAGLECRTVPTVGPAGEVVWAQACVFPNVKDLGEECTTDEQCVTGTCLKNYYTTGVCSLRCENNDCPDSAACVQLKGNEYWCSQKCGDGTVGNGANCPLDEPTPRFDVGCKIWQKRQGGAVNACENPQL